MSNSTTHLDLISAGQSNKEVVVNSLLDAASPAMLYGRRAVSTAGLTWGYFGGTALVGGVPASVANGTVTLTASATNYVEANPATGAVTANTSGFTSGSKRLYSVVTDAAGATSYTDWRTLGGDEGGVTSVNGQDGDVVLDAAGIGADPEGTAAAAIAAHAGGSDPHPQYLTEAEGDARYSPSGTVSTVTSQADAQTFTSSGTWTKPAGAKIVRVVCVGGGGGGGGGMGGAAASARCGGTGGGGGARHEQVFFAADLPATVSVTVGAGGTSGNGGVSASGADGAVGGSSSFGAYLTAYGGGGGAGGAAATNKAGAGGGGTAGAGQDGAPSNRSGGLPAITAGADGISGQGGGGAVANVGRRGEYGGGGGGGVTTGAISNVGGNSLYGGGGGGGGGGVNTSNGAFVGAAGGDAGTYSTTGASGGAATGAAGSAGSPGDSTKSGQGGGGGGGNSAGTGGAGGNGGASGGGGGGGGGGTSTGGNGGTGGSGMVRIYSW